MINKVRSRDLDAPLLNPPNDQSSFLVLSNYVQLSKVKSVASGGS